MSSAIIDDQEYDGSYVRCVLFRLDTENYGVNVQNVREVLRVNEIRPVPGAPFDVLGVINVRGVIVSVLDTRQFFKLYTGSITDLSRIIIVEQQGQTLGLLVDEVKEVRDIQEESIDAISAIGDDSNNRMIQGVTHASAEGVIIIIDSEKFFDGQASGGGGHAGDSGASAGDDDLF
ncbi:MAG: purine-binding chemotaxis protein CheW [Thiotrichales bacterium]|jgi:purine-binding chemotaxis protein CheW|nr:purine-binding chemotaxis protein CheW [Thiotrichales bacterium]